MSEVLTVNFTDVEVKDFDPLPKGSYHCKITDAEVRDNKDGPSDKNPTGQHISFELTVQPPHALADRKTWKSAPLGGDGVGILKSVLAATGRFTEEALDGELNFKLIEVIGADVLAVQGPRKDDPEQMECKRVKAYKPGTTAAAASGSNSLLP